MEPNSISKVKKYKKYYELTINNKEYIIDSFYYDSILPYQGKVLEVRQMIELIAFASCYQQIDKLEKKIFNNELSTYELKVALSKKDVSPSHIEQIVSFFKIEGYLKEENIINHYKEIYMSSKGVNYFKNILIKKHISNNAIEKALISYDEDKDNALTLAYRFIKSKQGSNKEISLKVKAMLINKGYSNKTINYVLDNITLNDENISLEKDVKKYLKKYPDDTYKVISKLALKGYNIDDVKDVIKKVGLENEN